MFFILLKEISIGQILVLDLAEHVNPASWKEDKLEGKPI